MPVVYETTTELTREGHVHVELDGLPFRAGTRLSVKLIPEPPFDATDFERRMQALIDDCSNNPATLGATKAQVLEELRRQREQGCQ